MSGDNTSTLQSYVDSATGAAQQLYGKISGSTTDEYKGDSTREKAAAENAASHSVNKLGPLAVGPTGAAVDSPDRSQGSWNQTIGSGKETLGNLLGNESLKQEGRQQNMEGQGQEAKGQLSDYGHGIGDRVKGAAGSGLAGLTGDRQKQEEYQVQHDIGKTQQRSAEQDIQKQGQY